MLSLSTSWLPNKNIISLLFWSKQIRRCITSGCSNFITSLNSDQFLYSTIVIHEKSYYLFILNPSSKKYATAKNWWEFRFQMVKIHCCNNPPNQSYLTQSTAVKSLFCFSAWRHYNFVTYNSAYVVWKVLAKTYRNCRVCSQ